MKKYGIYFLIFTLLFTVNPVPPLLVSATETTDETLDEEDVVLLSEQIDGEISLFETVEDITEDQEVEHISDDSPAVLLHTIATEEVDDIEYSFIRYEIEKENDEKSQTIEGYVESTTVIPLDLVKEIKEERLNVENEDANAEDEADETQTEPQEEPETEEQEVVEEDPLKEKEEGDKASSDISSDENKEEEKPNQDEEADIVPTTTAIADVKESKTSRLGRIKNKDVQIYESIGGKSSKAGSKHMDYVYYIKRQAHVGKDTYYLLSTQPSASKGIIGWIDSKEVNTHSHKGVDKKTKILYIKGNGNARSKAWGAKKDIVHSSLEEYKDETLKVNLTEKVGNNTWYRGKINGTGGNVWLHSSFVVEATESKTSRLGRIKNKNVQIYESIGGKASKAGSKHMDHVYYIKRQATAGKDTYYLISTQPSASKGTIGWVRSSDVKSHSHKGVDKTSKTLYIKGNGNARSKAWGAKKDIVHSSLEEYKDETLKVNLTEKVGNNTWYRGKINGTGGNVWLHSSFVVEATESKTSRLGRIKNKNVQIYESIGGKASKAGSKHMDHVYYIKRQATAGKDTYYLISTQPSASKGTIGWVRSNDVKSHSHKGVDKKSKTLYIKGNGNARSKAWGAKKDRVHSSLTNYSGQTFSVDLTEKVGNNTWYRGKINGKGNKVWLHSSFVVDAIESKTSRLARINNSNMHIYESIGGSSIKAGSKHTDAVYYVKKQAKAGKDTYYLLSTQPSASKGTIGWVRSTDVKSHAHKGVDKQPKLLYLNGKGNARSKAWGAKNDIVHSDLKTHTGFLFQINLTEKVGNNTWYRGKINGKGQTVWVHESFVTNNYEGRTFYNLTLTEAVNIQTNQSQVVYKGTTPVEATKSQIQQYLNPQRFMNDPVQRFQFLDLSKPSGASVSLLNKYLKGKGSLNNKGKVFYDAARKYGINDVYLISHAQLESGHGTSTLATGVRVGKDKKGNLKLVTKENEKNLTSIKTTYNMFGIGAIDNAALEGGAITAYENGWTTRTKAIDGGAKWISRQYIQNQFQQNTLYKMKWNPDMENGNAWKQYATDIAWASKQVHTIYNMYQEIGFPDAMAFDYPVYR